MPDATCDACNAYEITSQDRKDCIQVTCNSWEKLLSDGTCQKCDNIVIDDSLGQLGGVAQFPLEVDKKIDSLAPVRYYLDDLKQYQGVEFA